MTEPMPDPQGQRQAIPPRRPVAVGLLEPGRPHRSFPWHLVLIATAGLLLLALAIWRFTGS